MNNLQERTQNTKKVTHIKGRLPGQAVIHSIVPPFKMGTSLKGKKISPRGSEFFPLRAVTCGMENHFYHISTPPLNVAILLRMCVIA